MPIARQRFQIELLHIRRRRLQDHLKLHVLEQAVGILAVAAVGGTARGLHVADAIGLGTEHAQEGLGRHGSGADLDVVGLLQDAAVVGPESLQAQHQFLEGQRILRGSQMVRPDVG